MRAVLLAGVAAVLLLGCGIGGQTGYDQRGGSAIADRIRLASSPIVQEVSYRPGDSMDAATINIALKRGVGDDEARAFICSIVLPALASGEKPDSLSVDIVDDTSTLMYSVEPKDGSMSKSGAGEAESCGP